LAKERWRLSGPERWNKPASRCTKRLKATNKIRIETEIKTEIKTRIEPINNPSQNEIFIWAATQLAAFFM
jgi:hypothetical protein